MKIGAHNTYPISFDRVDNALEAMMSPSVEAVTGLITGPLIGRAEAIEVHSRLRTPDGEEQAIDYRMDKTFNGLAITGHAGGHPIEESVDTSTFQYQVHGRIGESPERLTISPVMGGFRTWGQVGEVPVQQDIAIIPWRAAYQITGHFGPVLMQLSMAPSPDGQSYTLQGSFGGQPVTGTIGPGETPDSIRVVRDVAGYQLVQEIVPVNLQPPPEEPPGEEG